MGKWYVNEVQILCVMRDLSKSDCVIREGEKEQICWLTCDLNN